MPHPPHQHRGVRSRLAAATIAGLFAGVARAITDWLLRQLPQI